MRKKYLPLSCLLLLVSLFCFFLFLSGKDSQKVETVLAKEYQNNESQLKNYGKEKSIQYLSESIGQYLEYLLLVRNEQEFAHQVKVLQDNFLIDQGEHTFVKWLLTEKTTTNASVDDLRIITSLFEAGEVFDEPRYLLLGEKLIASLLSVQATQGVVSDFYDWQEKQLANIVHLSYINFDLVEVIPSLDKTFYTRILEDSLHTAPFFTEVFLIEEARYQASDEAKVNLIEQLLIALQYHKAIGHPPIEFDEWITAEWRTNGKLYGRYDRFSHQPVVSYEASSVYALALIYFMETGKSEYAEQLYTILLKQPPFWENPDYNSMHVFDYLYAHTAAVAYKQSLK